jgi:hypothetical protein
MDEEQYRLGDSVKGAAVKHLARLGKRAASLLVKRILFATSPLWGTLLLVGGLVFFLFAALLWLPGEFRDQHGVLAFWYTGYDEWTLEQDASLKEEYERHVKDLGVSNESQPYTPSQYEQAEPYQLPWSILAAVDRVLGDPIFNEERKRRPRPSYVYERLKPRFMWKESIVIEEIEVTEVDEETGEETTHTVRNEYKVKLLKTAETFDAIHEMVYETETVKIGDATVTREKLAGINTQYLPSNENRLYRLLAEYDLPEGDIELIKEMALHYDDDPRVLALGFAMSAMLSDYMVPPDLIPIYKEAAQKYGVDWEVLASIHYEETRFSRGNAPASSKGARGPMQFMPATWEAYGVDGDGDGVADIENLYDAIFSAAHYLSKSGYRQDKQKAVYAYNHSNPYVQRVLSRAEMYTRIAALPAFDPSMKGSFPLPAGTFRISSPYGYRIHPISGVRKLHAGIDLAAPIGTPVYTPFDGVVTYAGWMNGYGYTVMIMHGEIMTLYAHLDSYIVKVGQKVNAGELIARVGNTGNSTGPHLHWGAYRGAHASHLSFDPLTLVENK